MYLLFDRNGSIIMAHVKILNRRTKPTHQLDHFAFEAVLLQQPSGYRVDQTVWRFQSPSLPLRARSAEYRFAVARARAEDRLHRQAARRPHSTSKSASHRHGLFLKRFDQSSPRAFSPHQRKTWLKGQAPKGFSWNIVMIAWRNESFASFMNFCFPFITVLLAIRPTTSLK